MSVALTATLRSLNPRLHTATVPGPSGALPPAPPPKKKLILKLAPHEEPYDEEEYEFSGRKMTAKQLQAEREYEEASESIPAPAPEPKRVITNAYLMGLVRENMKAEDAKKKDTNAKKAPAPAPAPLPEEFKDLSVPEIIKLPPQRKFTIKELADFDEIEYKKPFINIRTGEPYRENIFGMNPRGDIVDADFEYLGKWDVKTQKIIPAKISKERGDGGRPLQIHPEDWIEIRNASMNL